MEEKNNYIQINWQGIRGNRKPMDKSMVFKYLSQLNNELLNSNSNIYSGLLTSVVDQNEAQRYRGPYYVDYSNGAYTAEKLMLTHANCADINFAYTIISNKSNYDLDFDKISAYGLYFSKPEDLGLTPGSIISDMQVCMYKPHLWPERWPENESCMNTYFRILVKDEEDNIIKIAQSENFINWMDPSTYIETDSKEFYLSNPIKFIYEQNVESNKLYKDFWITTVFEDNINKSDNYTDLFRYSAIFSNNEHIGFITDNNIITNKTIGDEAYNKYSPNMVVRYKNENNLTTVNLVLNRQNQIIEYLMYKIQYLEMILHGIISPSDWETIIGYWQDDDADDSQTIILPDTVNNDFYDKQIPKAYLYSDTAQNIYKYNDNLTYDNCIILSYTLTTDSTDIIIRGGDHCSYANSHSIKFFSYFEPYINEDGELVTPDIHSTFSQFKPATNSGKVYAYAANNPDSDHVTVWARMGETENYEKLDYMKIGTLSCIDSINSKTSSEPKQLFW